MPGPAVPILLGVGVLGLLLLNKKNPPPIVPGSGGSFNDTNNARLSQLPLEVQQALSTPGAPPIQSAINAMAEDIANNRNVSGVIKGLSGQIFTTTIDDINAARGIGANVKPGDIDPASMGASTAKILVTVFTNTFNPPPPGMPAGPNDQMAFRVVSVQPTSFTAISDDPRFPNPAPVSGIPYTAITGMGTN